MNTDKTFRRQKLLPWWMIGFIWIFMFMGASGLAVSAWELILSPTGLGFDKELYGMQTYEGFSPLALFIKTLIIFKGVTAFGMWTEKNWAINFGIADAAIGIVVCVVMMFLQPLFEIVNGTFMFNFRFEILFLIPYLIKCLKIRKRWENREGTYSITTNIPSSDQEKQVIEKPEIKDGNIEKIEQGDNIDKEDPRRFMPT